MRGPRAAARTETLHCTNASLEQRFHATPLRRELTSERLFDANLIDGIVDPLDGERTGGEF
jgi:hypothetical protein